MAVSKIWRNIPERYNMIGKVCKECNELFFPQRDVCKKCGSLHMEDYPFIGRGKILTYTIIRTPISDPEGESTDIAARNIPYFLAIIGLEEGPMVTAEIVDCDEKELEIGKDVRAVFRKILEKGDRGVIQYGYKFRLA